MQTIWLVRIGHHTDKFILLGVVRLQATLARSYPPFSHLVFQQRTHAIVDQAVGIGGIMNPTCSFTRVDIKTDEPATGLIGIKRLPRTYPELIFSVHHQYPNFVL